MNLSEIKENAIFTIGETPSYPKLRTKKGYIDMRDKINIIASDLPLKLRLMTKEEVGMEFDGSIEDVDDWIDETKRHII